MDIILALIEMMFYTALLLGAMLVLMMVRIKTQHI